MNTPTQLEAEYRNLLITLARDALELHEAVKKMKDELPSERWKNRRAGLRNHINAHNRQRARLLQILSFNKDALNHFFGTTNPEEIAMTEKVLH
jgi:hypothetical protein